MWDAKILQVPAVQKEFYDRKNRLVEERIESLTTKKRTFRNNVSTSESLWKGNLNRIEAKSAMKGLSRN